MFGFGKKKKHKGMFLCVMCIFLGSAAENSMTNWISSYMENALNIAEKINENGTFYYENLNGRDIYGREVLSKFDTLTVDGSFVNKFDFFDSDDKKKSVGGTLVRNAIKVIPAFIPYVAPVYLGMRVGLNVVDLMGKFGKVFTGSDSLTLS